MENKTEDILKKMSMVYTKKYMAMLRRIVEIHGDDEEFTQLHLYVRDSLTKFFEDFVGVDPIDRDKRISALLLATGVVYGNVAGGNLEKVREFLDWNKS